MGKKFFAIVTGIFIFFSLSTNSFSEDSAQLNNNSANDINLGAKADNPKPVNSSEATSNGNESSNLIETKKPQVKIIKVVDVDGNKSISSSTIIAKIKIRPGDVFSQDILNDDLKRLYNLGYFTDIAIDVSDFDDGIKVIFKVTEKPVIDSIVFEGNRAIKEKVLKKEMKSAPEEMLDLGKLKSDIIELKKLYEKKGFPLTDINYEVKLNEETNRAAIHIIIDEKSKVIVKSITFKGNKAIRSKELLKVMTTRPHWLWISGFFKEEVFEADIDKLKAFYESAGYLDVMIDPDLKYNEKKDLLFVTINVTEGKKYTVKKVNITGNKIFPESDIRKHIKMKEGKPFSNEGMRMDIDYLQQYYYDRGYMSCELNSDIAVDKDNAKIEIFYSVVENDLTYIDKIKIKGNIRTKDVVVRRELRFFPGEKFDGSKIRRSKERLYNLGYFDEVSFDTESGSEPNKKNLIVNVKETKTGEFSFGGGYSSVDAFLGFAEVAQKNFDLLNFPTFTGAGQRLNIRAEVSTVRQNYELSWTDPWVLGFPYEFGFDAYRRMHDKAVGYAYNETTTGGDVRLGKEFTDAFRGNLTYKLEEVNINDIDSGASQALLNEEGKNTISSLIPSLSYDKRDNIYNPTRGYYLATSFQETGGFLGGDKNFYKYFASGEYYYSLFEKIVFQLKGQGGFANKFSGSNDVPIYERFFAGGQYTIRGYKERSVGPKDPLTGDFVGGNSMFVANAEVTFPIYEKLLKGAVFFDGGNVWEKASNFASSSLKYGTGVGVRVKTPIGPVSLDLGYPLSNLEGEKKKPRFYFSVSRGF